MTPHTGPVADAAASLAEAHPLPASSAGGLAEVVGWGLGGGVKRVAGLRF